MANLIRKTCTKPYQNWPHFMKDMTKTFWCVFRFAVLTAVYLQNADAKFLQGKVETLFRRGGKRLHFCVTNLSRTIHTKFYHSRSGFVDYISKTFWCFFGSQCSFLMWFLKVYVYS